MIEEEAARLVVRLNIDPAERAAALQWAAQSALHSVAFARAEANWELTGRLGAASSLLDDDAEMSAGNRHGPLVSRRMVASFLIAASLAGVGGMISLPYFEKESYSTKVGERRLVKLADGSTMQLNTDTLVDVAFRKQQRLVWLIKGEALFQVTHDASRPFLVHIGSATFRAIGTAFNVRLKQELIELTVAEGVVGVKAGNASEHRIPANEGAVIRNNIMARTNLDPAKVRRMLAWKDGVIELDGETILQAVEEFNRYIDKPLVVSDARIAAIRVGGRFDTDNSLMFVDALQRSFGIRAIVGEDNSILLIGTSPVGAPSGH